MSTLHKPDYGNTGCGVFLWGVKFIYSEKATKFCKIFTLLFTGTIWDKSKVKILQNFVAFSEYMNFIYNKEIFSYYVTYLNYLKMA